MSCRAEDGTSVIVMSGNKVSLLRRIWNGGKGREEGRGSREKEGYSSFIYLFIYFG